MEVYYPGAKLGIKDRGNYEPFLAHIMCKYINSTLNPQNKLLRQNCTGVLALHHPPCAGWHLVDCGLKF